MMSMFQLDGLWKKPQTSRFSFSRKTANSDTWIYMVMDMPEGEEEGTSFLPVVAAQWLWYHICSWHHTVAAEWRAPLFQGQGRGGNGVLLGSCVELPICAIATDLGQRRAWLGCILVLGVWPTEGFEPHSSCYTEACISELEYLFLYGFPLLWVPWKATIKFFASR